MTDLYALITELADELDHNRQCLLDDRRLTHPLADKARAVLAEADGPAMSNGREPASVDDILALRVHRLEAMRETEKTALLDAFRQIDRLKERIDWQYTKIHRLENAIAAHALPVPDND